MIWEAPTPKSENSHSLTLLRRGLDTKTSRSKLGAPPLGVSVANSQAHCSAQSTICQHLSDHQATVMVLLRAQGDHCTCVIHTLATRHWRLNMRCFVNL